MSWFVVLLASVGALLLWFAIYVVQELLHQVTLRSYMVGKHHERERCALLAEHCAHSCVTKGHCDALHAAHSELARQIRDRGD
jgi:hypothetical protein